jgi:hypothetical protein
MSERMRACPREGEVLAAVATGMPGPELARHVAGCAECREVFAVSAWLQGVARETDVGALPRAERVWWRAQVERRLATRRELAERAARPIRWFERGAAAAVAMIVTAILWEQGMSTASAALARLSDPTTLGALAAGLMTLAGLAAREAVRKP